ncbi:hypothetical protein J5491_02435 [Candidatus Saccharibacteria bacterium]|nr:hypothetical protein [Candidatus Saccharibacteria bacterium]
MKTINELGISYMPNTPGENPQDNHNEQNEDPKTQSKELGAKTLSQVGFNERNKKIVDSSFNKALKKGEKLSGKNGERRSFAYLSRLEKLIEKHGNAAEKKLWEASIKDNLLIEYDNITESYWDSKKQELRDNGYGNVELTEDLKHQYYEKEREFQKESLEKWANYLGDEHSPYPLWFKIYAWDGMTKMGVYNKGKNKYETRNETTVAPYPDPDPEILAAIFDVVNRYHGNGEKEFYTEEGERNINLENVVQSGNFSKIYNAIRQDIAPVIEPPERAEDVKGEWVEYGLGEEDDIARAARGTGWCVATSSVGRHYLKYGTYGNDADDHDDDWGDDDWIEDDGEDHDDDDWIEDDVYDYYEDESEDESNKNKAKFILFHLIDPKTGKLAKNGCASIRLDPDGNVAEISGLKKGQALHDSIVGIVEEKIKSLPGGEEFLPKFADKNRLIALDRKMENGEDLTTEELEFLYEVHREIATLDTYNSYDPRVSELREKYSVEYALNHGVNADGLVSNLDPRSIAENLDALVAHGADIDDLVLSLNLFQISENLDALLSHGADIDSLVLRLDAYDIIENLDTLISHGADIDSLVSWLDLYQIAGNLDTLISHGANIDIDDLVSRLDPRVTATNLDALISHGASIDMDALISKLHLSDTIYILDTLISHGANIDTIVNATKPKENFQGGADVIRGLDTLIDHGADIDAIVSKIGPTNIYFQLNNLIEHGANIDNLVSMMRPGDVTEKLDTLISHGAKIDINELVSNLQPAEIAQNLDVLLSHNAKIDIDELVSNLQPEEITRNLDVLLRHKAKIDIDELVSNLQPGEIDDYALGIILKHNLDINKLVSVLGPEEIEINLETLLERGADPNLLIDSIDPGLVAHDEETQDILRRYGANV